MPHIVAFPRWLPLTLRVPDADLLIYDPLGACTSSFMHKLYG